LKLRDRRKPKPKAVGVPGHDATDDFQPVFLKRYIPPAHVPNHSAAESAKTD
jgi:hypothetical protein